MSHSHSADQKPVTAKQKQRFNLLNQSLLVSSLIIVSRLLGLAREILLAASLGISAITDVFQLASNLLRMSLMLLDSLNQRASVPFLVAKQANTSDKDQAKIIRGLSTQYVWLTSAIALVIWFSQDLILPWLAPGFTPQTLSWLKEAWWMICCSLPVLGLIAVSEGVLGSRYRYWMSYVAQFWNNATVVFFLAFLYEEDPAYNLIAAAVIGLLLTVVTALIFVGSLRFNVLPQLKVSFEHYRQLYRQALPAMMTSGFEFILLFVGIAMMSKIGEGAITQVSYALKLYFFPQVLFVYALTRLVGTKLAEFWQTNREKFIEVLDWGIAVAFSVMLPAGLGMALVSQPLVEAVFERGEFTQQNTQETALALSYLAINLPLTAVNNIFMLSYFSRIKRLTPMLITAISVLFTWLVWWLLITQFQLGVKGYGLGIACAAGLSCILHLFTNYRSGEWRWQAVNRWLILRSCLACLAMILVLLALQEFGVFSTQNASFELLGLITLAVITYGSVHLLTGTRLRYFWRF